jgi:hypothetical protein
VFETFTKEMQSNFGSKIFTYSKSIITSNGTVMFDHWTFNRVNTFFSGYFSELSNFPTKQNLLTRNSCVWNYFRVFNTVLNPSRRNTGNRRSNTSSLSRVFIAWSCDLLIMPTTSSNYCAGWKIKTLKIVHSSKLYIFFTWLTADKFQCHMPRMPENGSPSLL